MSFRLKEAVFKIRCREPGCPFNSEFTVRENIMGATEADVDVEAQKIARNLGFIKHDAVFGRSHQLTNPEVAKVSATYDRIGVPQTPAPSAPQPGPGPAQPTVPTRTFRRGELIVKRGDTAATVCQVIRGSALNEKLPGLRYTTGAIFGAAAIFRQKNRMVDIVAGEDGTTIAYYDIKELARTNAQRAHELYDAVMDDVFNILGYLEDRADGLEKKVTRLTTEAQKTRVAAKATAKKAVRQTKKIAAKVAKRLVKMTAKKSTKKPVKKAVRKAVKKTTKKKSAKGSRRR
ncbi:MAG TPA: hypothetical protein VHE79_11595 [Spirochaetia bacterium]